MSVIVHDLSQEVLSKLTRVNLATVTEEPPSPIDEFEFHGCVCGVANFVGQPPWELHTTGDELLHVLAGESQLIVHENGESVARTLGPGDLAIVPRGCWHRNNAPDGVTMLFMTPRDGNDHSWDDPSPRGAVVS